MQTNRPWMESVEPRRMLAFTASGGSTVTGAEFQSADEIIAVDGGFIAAGTFAEDTNFGPGIGVRQPLGRSDVFLSLVRGNTTSLYTIGGESRQRLKFNDDRVDFAAAPRRLGEEFTYGVSSRGRRTDESVSTMAIGPDGKLYVALIFRRAVSLNTANPRAMTLKPSDEFGDFFDSAILRYSIRGSKLLFENAMQIGGPFNDIIQDIDFDTAGNLIVAGSFERRADFDPGRRAKVLEPEGRSDAFVAKYTTGGSLIWVDQFGGDEAGDEAVDVAYGVSTAADGAIYVGGTFSGEADFDPRTGRANERLVEADGATDGFTMRLNADGTLGWVQVQGGSDFDGVRDVTSGPGGGVYSVGYFEDEADVDPRADRAQIFTATEDDGNNAETTDLFYTRFDAAGNVVWVKQLAGSGYELLADAETDIGGNLVLSGSFAGRADFDPSKRQAIRTTPESDDVDDANQSNREHAYSGFVAIYSPTAKLIASTQLDGAREQDVFITGSGIGISTLPVEPPGEGIATIITRILVAGRYRGGVSIRGDGGSLAFGNTGRDLDDYREDAFTAIFEGNLKPIT